LAQRWVILAMTEPPTKKARTAETEEPGEEDASAGNGLDLAAAAAGDEGENGTYALGAEGAEVAEPAAEAEELETDDTSTGPKVKEKAVFYTEDTTINVMCCTKYGTLTNFTDGGLQYLFAGARTNLGVKSGRYMFEVRIMEVMNPLEDTNARARMLVPKNQVRLGFAAVKSSLFLGHSEEAVGFDSDGYFLHGRTKTQVGQRFSTGDVAAVVLNLNSSGPNANTISLFKNGKRVSPPQPLPASLKDKGLYPLITFKNVTLNYNFGPSVMVPLPFKCRTVNEVLSEDVVKKKEHQPPADGMYEVVFPISLPDEGGFDWLDQFLQKNATYVELSDRSLLSWCEKSGLTRPKGFSPLARVSNDKPDMGFGLPQLDDLSVRRLLSAVATIQPRNYVVMEIRGNLMKEERLDQLPRWYGYRRVGAVLIGEPPAAFKRYSQEQTLKVKQEQSDIDFRTKQQQEKQQFFLQKRQKQMEKDKRKAARKSQKTKEAMVRKLKYEQARKEAEAKGEPIPDPPEEEKDDDEEEEDAEEDPEPMDQDPPTVELTEEEKQRWFTKNPVPDLTMYLLNTSFQKFSLPDKDEEFDELRYNWYKEDKAQDYLTTWVQDKKLISRVEDLQPGDGFVARWKEWQKSLSVWHQKQNAFKAADAKKALDAKEREGRKKAYELQVAAAAKEGKDPPEKPEDLEAESPKEAPKTELDYVDVFGVEDVDDIGGGEPLYSAFQFEDWSMLTLRFELHLLSHAFRKDANDPDRISVPVDHLQFYYSKYFKKALSAKTYGVDSIEEVIRLVRDTIIITRNPKSKLRVIESQLPDELECLNVFIMLTEEHRRERQRRADLGDDSLKLKVVSPGMANVTPAGNIILPSGALSAGGASPLSSSPMSAASALAASATVVRPVTPIASPQTVTPRPASPGGLATPTPTPVPVPVPVPGPGVMGARPGFGAGAVRPNFAPQPRPFPGWGW